MVNTLLSFFTRWYVCLFVLLLHAATTHADPLDASPTVFDTLGPAVQYDASYYQVGDVPSVGNNFRTAAQFTASVTGNLDVVYLAEYGPNGVDASTALEAYLYHDVGGTPDEGNFTFLGSVPVAWFQYYPPSAYNFPLYWFTVPGTVPVTKDSRYWLVLKQGTPTGSYAWNKSLPSIEGPVFQSIAAGPWAPVGPSPQILPGFKLTARDVVGESYPEWQGDHFSESQRNDPSISGWNADPDSDGVPNGFEYYFNFDPLDAGSAALPQLRIQTVFGLEAARKRPQSTPIDFAFFTYLKRIGAPVSASVGVSDDLLTWDETGNQAPQYGDASLTGDNVTEIVTAALGLNRNDHGHKFFRLKVSLNAVH